jgi:hypothetical protein
MTVIVTKKSVKKRTTKAPATPTKQTTPAATPKKKNVNTTNPQPFNTNLPSKHISMTLMEKGYIEPENVNINLAFQRHEELGMYDEAYPIVLDQNDGCPDGKHRVIMSREKNLPLIPYVRYHFKTEDDKMKYFHIAQLQPQGMKARDELYSYYLAKHAYTELLYSLCGQNAPTLFSSCSDLKMNQTTKMSNSNIKVVHLCYMVNSIVLGIKTGWARTHADSLYKKSLPHLNQKSYKINCQKMEEFINFFMASTGWTVSKKDLRFKEHFMLGFMDFYIDHLLVDPKFKVKKERKRIMTVLKNYPIISEVVTNHKVVIVQKLLKEINFRKSAEKCYI